MDPLSIIASIAGIASAGAQLSNTLFKLYKTVKNAPREIQLVAIEMSGLTSTLEHLHDIIRTGQSYAKPQFCDAVRHVVKNIQVTQEEIDKMVADESMLRRVKWLKASRLLSDIDKHKVTLTLQIAILSAAVLVKSTSGRLSIQKKVENRFKAQAESLVLAGQASFQNDESEPIPDPPQERAPSPPVRTSKRLPSPVRESEIPGHVRTEELYGQSKNEDNAFLSASEKEEVHSALALSVKDTVLPERRYTVPAIDDKDEEGISSEDEDRVSRRRGRSGFDPLSGRSIAQFGPDFHRRGDAATFLYNLVFLNEMPVKGKPDQSSHLRDIGSEEKTEVRYRHPHSDDLYDDEYYDSGNKEGPRERVRFKNPNPQEPGRIVNRLLLAWTSLSENELEKGKPDNQADRSKAFEESDSSDSEESLYGSENPDTTWRREARSARNRFLREEINYNNKPEFDPRGRRILRPTQTSGRPFEYTNAPPRNNGFSPVSAEPTMPYPNGGYGQPYAQARNPYAPSYGSSDQTSWMPGASNSSHRYPFPPPPPGETYSPPSTQSQNPATETKPVRSKFQKPGFVVLPQTDFADYEAGPMTPKLDLTSVNLGIMRQGDEPIWDCDAFMSEKGYPGKAIMGALIGDKSARNPHGLDLAHTLMKGRSLKLVYIRGNDLGETWFINEQPVFLQFLHSGYLPQFYPAKETDERAMKEEYVAIGEEWASFEALQQLGLVVKGREEGRVLLDPSSTWSMIKELATTTLQLRSMRQRRTFTSTFYKPLSLFQQKHRVEVPSLVATTISQTRVPAVPDRRATVEDESEVDIIELPINKKPKNTPEENTDAQSSAAPSTLQPQISITPPSTPQQTSPDYLDTSEVASHVSSGSRLSRFVKRYKTGGKKNLSLPLHRQSPKTSGNGSESIEWQDDDKRPLTPTDSGVGSSIVSGR
ncbi:uncharacterized protein FMAN_11568 [Fusarium mangiferae]|uniref:Fungal N-terminal domain-containing protein n=1 Tax=Fusarium mangiferae TaxID=192010 RepID=A0A1L7THY7_FUSMA|nr:uncharacterized protein FMAN_11568 [Fusarium mangiferae]CVK97529.1 uncharacterized protein FMAN_11568 [Fusarium mangiferae]